MTEVIQLQVQSNCWPLIVLSFVKFCVNVSRMRGIMEGVISTLAVVRYSCASIALISIGNVNVDYSVTVSNLFILLSSISSMYSYLSIIGVKYRCWRIRDRFSCLLAQIRISQTDIIIAIFVNRHFSHVALLWFDLKCTIGYDNATERDSTTVALNN